jgi:hypothetical protein
MASFIDYKQIREINAFDYLTRFEDFTVSRKSNKSWIDRNNPSGTAVIENHQTGETFLVRKDARNSLEYRIMPTDGSLIPTAKSQSRVVDLLSFIAWLHNTDFATAAQRIMANVPSLLDTQFKQVYSASKKVAPISQKQLSDRIFKNCTPLNDYSYLLRRHISTDIIKDPIFFGRIGSFKNKSHGNLCFHCYDANDKFVTTCQRYFLDDKAVKQFPYFKDSSGVNQSPSTNGTIWRSNTPEHPEFVLFSESPEDALSYYQLHYASLAGKTLICSSLGTFRQDHGNLISALCDELAISKVILANDNDTAGTRFDLMALCAIKPSGSNNCPILNASCSLIENEQHQHVNKLQFQFSFNQNNFKYAEKLYNHIEFSLINNEVRLAVSDGLFKSDDNTWKFDLFCKNDLVHIEDVLQMIEMADKSNYFKNHFLIDKSNDLIKKGDSQKSIIKDWNEFLQHFDGNKINSHKKNNFLENLSDGLSNEKKKHLKIHLINK